MLPYPLLSCQTVILWDKFTEKEMIVNAHLRLLRAMEENEMADASLYLIPVVKGILWTIDGFLGKII